MRAVGARVFLAFVALCCVAHGATGAAQYGGAGGRHYTRSAQIDRDNVARLERAWEYRIDDADALPVAERRLLSYQASPLKLPAAAGGLLLLCTPLSRVVALDPETGAERWRFDPQVRRDTLRPFNCRGVSYWDAGSAQHCGRRVFVASYDRRLIALDAATGERCSGFGVRGEVDMMPVADGHARGEVTHPSPPAVIGNVVVVGSGVIDFAEARAPSGAVRAFDARDGRALWSFDPLPAEAVEGEWPAEPRLHSGAANVWAPITVDPARDLVFLATSAPSPDYYGAARPGDNRHANSVVALRGATGELVWSYQIVHHDLWDYDLPAQPILARLEVGGRRVPAVIQLTKQGFVFALDRATGVPLWPVEERAVPQSALAEERPAPTQPVPLRPEPLLPARLPADQGWGFTPWDRARCRDAIAGLRHEGLFTPVTTAWTLMYPGSLGGANWGGGGLDPERGLLLVNFNTVPARARLVPQDSGQHGGSVTIEGYNWRMVMSGTPWIMETGMLVSPLGAPCSPPPWGELAALDLRRGEWLWRVPLGSVHELGPVPLPFEIPLGTPNLGGGLLTRSGLFFIGATLDRRLRAFDVESGEVLWRARLPADAHATPVSYESGGRQYIVVVAGSHHMFDRRPAGGAVMAFALPR